MDIEEVRETKHQLWEKIRKLNYAYNLVTAAEVILDYQAEVRGAAAEADAISMVRSAQSLYDRAREIEVEFPDLRENK